MNPLVIHRAKVAFQFGRQLLIKFEEAVCQCQVPQVIGHWLRCTRSGGKPTGNKGDIAMADLGNLLLGDIPPRPKFHGRHSQLTVREQKQQLLLSFAQRTRVGHALSSVTRFGSKLSSQTAVAFSQAALGELGASQRI